LTLPQSCVLYSDRLVFVALNPNPAYYAGGAGPGDADAEEQLVAALHASTRGASGGGGSTGAGDGGAARGAATNGEGEGERDEHAHGGSRVGEAYPSAGVAASGRSEGLDAGGRAVPTRARTTAPQRGAHARATPKQRRQKIRKARPPAYRCRSRLSYGAPKDAPG